MAMRPKIRKILGLDCSTTTIGIAVLMVEDDKIILSHHNFYKPPKKGEFLDRLACVYEFIYTLVKDLNPDEVAIEDIILFMKGRSTAKTISGLAVLNRTVGLAVRHAMNKNPNLLNVMKIRHQLKTDGILPSKEQIPQIISKKLNIDFPWRYKKSRKSGKSEIMIENYDIADAISCAYCHIVSQEQYDKSKKIKNLKKDKARKNTSR